MRTRGCSDVAGEQEVAMANSQKGLGPVLHTATITKHQIKEENLPLSNLHASCHASCPGLVCRALERRLVWVAVLMVKVIL